MERSVRGVASTGLPEMLASSRSPGPAPTLRRSLLAIALHNAVEGLVRETYGAAVARFAHLRGPDPHLSRALASIARDECAHAALSFRVAEWIVPRLDREGRARHDDAIRGAIAELRREIAGDATPPELRRALGLPSRGEAETLLGHVAGIFATAARGTA